MRRLTASSGSSLCLGVCNFLLDVMRGSELASILLITSWFVRGRLIFRDRCSMVNFITLFEAKNFTKGRAHNVEICTIKFLDTENPYLDTKNV